MSPRRRSHVEQISLSDDGDLSAESSRESFEDSVGSDVGSDHGRGSHPLPAVRRRRHRDSPHGSNCDSPRDRTEESSEGADSSHEERRHRRTRSRKRDTNRKRRTPGSESSSLGGDGDVPDNKADREGATKAGCDSSRERRKKGDRDWNRHSPRRWRDKTRSKSGDHQLSDTTSDSGCEEDNRKWGVAKHSKAPKKRAETHRDASSRTDSYSDTNEEGARQPNNLEGEDSQSCTTSPERRRSDSREGNMIKKTRHRRRRRAELDDSEAEGYGWSGNKYSWDSADAASTGRTSDQQVISGQTPDNRLDDEARKNVICLSDVQSDDGNEGAAHETGGDKNNATDTQRSSAESRRTNAKELGNSEAWEGDREQQPTGSGHDETLRGSISSVTPRHSSGAEHVRSPAAEAAGGAVTVGKPIRGARWGEAIGVRSRVFDTSTIPTKRVDLKKFVSCPLQSGPGTVLRCFIERDRSGTHKFSNMFSMYADLEDGSGRMLLAARKVNTEIQQLGRRKKLWFFVSKPAVVEEALYRFRAPTIFIVWRDLHISRNILIANVKQCTP